MNVQAPPISDHQRKQADMDQLMNDILSHHRGDERLQRTSGFTKLLILADKAGIELLEWMKHYALSENHQTASITLPPEANGETHYAIEAMKAVIECYPEDARKRALQLKRNGYNSLIRFAYRARVPLIEWIISYYKTACSIQLLPDNQTLNVYKCPNCNESFRSADALKGHGPNRCRAKNAVTAFDAHES